MDVEPKTSVVCEGFSLSVRPCESGLGAEISGVDLNAGLSDAVFQAVRRAFLEYQLLIFSDQEVSPGSHVAFAKRFGPVQIHVMNQYRSVKHPELYTLTNLDEDGKPTGNHPDRGTLYWHTDASWEPLTGLATCMYATTIPTTGGETHFCDMYVAWERLPEHLKKRVEGKRALHSLHFSRTRRHGEGTMTEEQRQAVPPVDHPIVRTHPETGRKCLFLGDHAQRVLGLSVDEGRALVEEVNAAAVEVGTVHRHRWKPNQFLVWDNRCMLHRVTEYDTQGEARVIRRCTVIENEPPSA